MAKQRKVYILPGAGATAIQAMFLERGWAIADDIYDADLVQFCGGEDVNPYLYGEYPHERTNYNPDRDEEESRIYHDVFYLGTPMAGICRGGQFLHVMNGGSLWQDVDGHAVQGTHEAYIVGDLIPVQVSSTHHQMIKPSYNPDNEWIVLMTADQSTKNIHMSGIDVSSSFPILHHRTKGIKSDIEAVFYPKTKCLCFQPHPEFKGPMYKECRDVYFKFIEENLFDEDKEGEVVLHSL